MDWVNLVATVLNTAMLLYIAMAYFHLNKVQKPILESVKAFMEIFKIDEVKKYADLIKANAEMEKTESIKSIEKQNAEAILELQQTVHASEARMGALMSFGLASTRYVPPEKRQDLINETIKDEQLRASISELVNRGSNVYIKPSIEELVTEEMKSRQELTRRLWVLSKKWHDTLVIYFVMCSYILT